jgi:hypothetical protein
MVTTPFRAPAPGADSKVHSEPLGEVAEVLLAKSVQADIFPLAEWEVLRIARDAGQSFAGVWE